MVLRRVYLLLIVSLASLVFALPTFAGETDAFMRVTKSATGEPLTMDTAIVRYHDPQNKFYVDLVSAVHIGEQSYFQALNKQFDSYDAVLYELVAPKGKIPQKGERSTGVLSSFQLGLTNMLNLSFQLDEIDYTKKNFIHADTTPEEFSQDMKDRGESFFTMFMRLMMASYAHGQQVPQAAMEAQMLMLILDPNKETRARGLKRVMADQFQNTDFLIQALNGEEGSTLIAGRNDAALRVLRETIAKGKKRIAIFYGGGHMPDFDTKLVRDFKLRRGKTEWVPAWDLSK